MKKRKRNLALLAGVFNVPPAIIAKINLFSLLAATKEVVHEVNSRGVTKEVSDDLYRLEAIALRILKLFAKEAQNKNEPNLIAKISDRGTTLLCVAGLLEALPLELDEQLLELIEEAVATLNNQNQ